jgi:hypothetical protein
LEEDKNRRRGNRSIRAEEDGTLALTFAIFSGEREVANGVAVFEREVASGE